MKMPKKIEGCLVTQVGEEQLVYPPEQAGGEAHCLTPPAAFAFESCDGQATVESVAAQWSEQSEASLEESQTLIASALVELQEAGLLQASAKTFNRREFLKYGQLAAAGTLILSVGMPSPAAANSYACIDNNQPDPCGGTFGINTPIDHCHFCSTPGPGCAAGNRCVSRYIRQALGVTPGGMTFNFNAEYLAGPPRNICAAPNAGTIQDNCVAARNAAPAIGQSYFCCNQD